MRAQLQVRHGMWVMDGCGSTLLGFHPIRVVDTGAYGGWRQVWHACGSLCSNYRVEIGTVGIRNLEDLANRNSSVTVRTLIH